MNDKLIQVYSFDNPIGANMLKSKLESEGIECFLPDEEIVSANMFLSTAVGSIKVMVKESDFEKAQKVINDFKMDLNVIDESALNEDIYEYHGNITCPECSSDKVIFYRHKRTGAALSIILLGFPLIYPSKVWKCEACGCVWQEKKSFAVNVVTALTYFGFMLLIIILIRGGCK